MSPDGPDEPPQGGRAARVAVRDAASLIVVDRAARAVLMGRRSMRHVFMPGITVFPGGRVDPGDARVRVAADFDEVTAAKLVTSMRGGGGSARARALGVAAVRETYEETGVIVGRLGATVPTGPAFLPFSSRGVGVDLSAMRFLMRAITPPGRSRRFDARFLVVARQHVADTDPARVGPDAELEDIGWVAIADAARNALAPITRTVLAELALRLEADPELSPDAPVPFVRWQRTAFVRELL